MKLLKDAKANYFIKGTGIARRTFFTRVIERGVSYIELNDGDRYYSVKDFLKKNPDYSFKKSLD